MEHADGLDGLVWLNSLILVRGRDEVSTFDILTWIFARWSGPVRSITDH